MQVPATHKTVAAGRRPRCARSASRQPLAVSAQSSSRVVPEQAPVDDSAAGPSRRHLMAALTVMVMGPAAVRPVMAINCAELSNDDEVQFECRKAVLANGSTGELSKEQYGSKASEQKFSAAPGVPVASLDSEYERATLKLREDILTYATMDVQDYKTRVPLLKTLKTEGTEWVSKYARGGSARTQSARTMYIAVDAVVGHIQANGYAPMPASKLKVALGNLDKAMSFLAERR